VRRFGRYGRYKSSKAVIVSAAVILVLCPRGFEGRSGE
jgi:hypothetical protein